MPEEIAKVSSVKELLLRQDGILGPYDVDFGALGPGPHAAIDRKRCDRYFLIAWTNTLTDQEAEFIEVWPNVPDSAIRQSMNHKADKLILEFASVVGKPFIDYCLVFQRRMFDWRKDPGGPRLYRRYGEALAHGAEVEQSPPYEGPKAILQEPHAYLFREQAFKEWGLLRERIKAFRVENPHVKTIDGGLWSFIESQVLGAEVGRYRLLKCRLSNLKNFLSYQEAENNLDTALRWRVEGFVKHWMAYGTGREAVSLGHDIGKMGKRLKDKV